MKSVFAATAAAAFGMALQLPSAIACDVGGNAAASQPSVQQANAAAAEAPRYEWQYHSTGRHARYTGYWAPVR